MYKKSLWESYLAGGQLKQQKRLTNIQGGWEDEIADVPHA